MEEEKRGGEGLEEKRERERKGKGGKEGDGGCGPPNKNPASAYATYIKHTAC